MICSSLNLDCFIRPSLRWAGLYLPLEEFQGVTSAANPRTPPFRFAVGQGDPPTGAGTLAAIGNLGPMIQKGLPYGVGNQ